MTSKRTTRATLLLQKLLEDGVVSIHQLRKSAKEANVSWRTMQRAKDELQVQSIKEGFPGLVVGWALPDDHEPYVPQTFPPAALAAETKLRNRARKNGRTVEEQRMYEWLAKRKYQSRREMNAHLERGRAERQDRVVRELRLRKADEVD